jgi:hypothetical protein
MICSIAMSAQANDQQINPIEVFSSHIIYKPKIQEKYIVEEYIVDIEINTTEVELIAKTVYGEAGNQDAMGQAAVIWCILNRVDAGYGTITEVITAKNQFVGYRRSNPVKDEIKALTEDVLARWQMEKICCGEVGRVLPSDYLWFRGDGQRNYFRNAYRGNYDVWDWDCWNPYTE